MSNDNWKKYPAAMLRARASSALADAVYPDLTLGIGASEVVGDSGEESDAAPIAPTLQPPAPRSAAKPQAVDATRNTDAPKMNTRLRP